MNTPAGAEEFHPPPDSAVFNQDYTRRIPKQHKVKWLWPFLKFVRWIAIQDSSGPNEQRGRRQPIPPPRIAPSHTTLPHPVVATLSVANDGTARPPVISQVQNPSPFVRSVSGLGSQITGHYYPDRWDIDLKRYAGTVMRQINHNTYLRTRYNRTNFAISKF